MQGGEANLKMRGRLGLVGVALTSVAVGLLVAGLVGGFGLGYLHYTPQITLLESKSKQLLAEVDRLKNEMDTKIKELQQKDAELNKAREELERVEKELSNVEERLAEARRSLEARTAEVERLTREAQTLTAERDKLKGQISSLEAEVSNLRKEINALNTLLESFRRRVSELEAAASPLVNGTWQQIAKFERTGKGWKRFGYNEYPDPHIDTVTIPKSLAIRLKITRLSGNLPVWWLLSKPRDNQILFIIARDNTLDVIAIAIHSATSFTTGREEILLYDMEPGEYTIYTYSDVGVRYEVVVEAFIPR